MRKSSPISTGAVHRSPPLASTPAVGHDSSCILTHLSAIFENTQDAIWSVDLDRRFVTFNSFMRERIRAWWGVEILPGKRHGGNTGDEAEFWKEIYSRAFQGEHVLAKREYFRPEGNSQVEFSVNPIREAQGRIVGAAGIARDITHLHKLNARVLEREEAFRHVLNSTGDVIWSVDPQYRFITFNLFLHRIILAATGQEIAVGMSHLDVGPDEEEPAFWKAAYDRALQGESFKIEREYLNPAGHAIVEFSLNPIREGECITGVAGVGRDVSHLRAITSALETSETAYRILFQDSPLPMWTVDLETLHFVQFNRAAMKLYGYSEEEFEGLTLLDVRPVEDRQHFSTVTLETIRADRSDRHYRSTHLRKSGKILNVEIFSHYLEIGGRPSRLTLVKDVTKQRHAELKLLEANERFRLAAEAVTSVIWEWDVQRDLLECFGPLHRVTGFDAIELGKKAARFWIARIHPKDRWRVARSFIEALRKKSHFETECRLQCQNGEFIYLWSNGTIVRDSMGRPVRVVGSSLDITERKRMELELEHERESAVLAKERAEEMSRLKSSFLANMSHEIRTPLTAILGFAEVLSDELNDPEKRQHALMIQSSGNRLLATINQILDLAKIEAGKVELNPASYPVRHAVEECVEILGPLAKKKGLHLEIAEPSIEFHATFDKLYFHQILTNLIGNAIKFTHSGSVRVSVLQCNTPGSTPFCPTCEYPAPESLTVGSIPCPCFAVEVHDDGVGISKEFLPRIFDEFKQESDGYNRNYEGTGIGLTITAKLVELMHGSITASSALGKGSRFIVQLPMA